MASCCRYLRKVFTEDVVRELLGSANALSELEEEWRQLEDDRRILRQIFPSGENKVVLPCNLQRMIWNAQKIFRINIRSVTELHPMKIIEGKKKYDQILSPFRQFF